MLDTVIWLIVIELIGLASFPFCYYLLPFLRDRGYCVSKPIGILILGYFVWMLSVLNLLPSIQPTIIGLTIGFIGLSIFVSYKNRRELKLFFNENLKVVIVTELVFMFFLLFWIIYKTYDPNINHTEQPMDFGFFNASIRSVYGHPQDPWLSGNSIDYYYFGYWILGTITEMVGMATEVAYNLSIALIAALSASCIFGLGVNLVSFNSNKSSNPYIAGAAGVVLLMMIGNLQVVLEFLRFNLIGSIEFWNWVSIQGLVTLPETAGNLWRPTEHWWWWHATRVINTIQDGATIDYVIHEFPFFSFMLGDLHPHMVSIPFLLTFISFCWNYFRTPFKGINSFPFISSLVLGAFLFGSISFINMWELPVTFSIFAIIVLIKIYIHTKKSVGVSHIKEIMIVPTMVILGSLMFLPNLMNFTSQVEGIGVLDSNMTRFFHFILVWGVHLPIIVSMVLYWFWKTDLDHNWKRTGFIALLIALGPYFVWGVAAVWLNMSFADLFSQLMHVSFTIVMIGFSIYSLFWFAERKQPEYAKIFTLVLTVIPFMLLMGAELFYIDDSFSGGSERMNTVFKFYYQSWILFSIVAGISIYYGRHIISKLFGVQRIFGELWKFACVILICSAFYYVPATLDTRTNSFQSSQTLNGLQFIAKTNRDEYEAIKFLQKDKDASAVLVEAPGGGYNDYGRISSSTGIPTLIGWIGHETQWRGTNDAFEARLIDVANIYTSPNLEITKAILSKYNVKYVYIGHREVGHFTEEQLGKFGLFMDLVFNSGNVYIYQIRS
tara:strand:+ start:4976 stop:7306 length:2331 start_codon:yes stop_codon:yes gene_type:complete